MSQLFHKTRSDWRWAVTLLLCITYGKVVPLARAEPAQEGRIIALDIPVAIITQDSTTSWLSPPIKYTNSDFLRIHFTGIQLEGAGTGMVRVIGEGGNVLAQWTFKEFAARGERWTHLLPEGYAVVQAVRYNDQPVRLQFTIKEAARESKGGSVLSRQRQDKMQDKDISAYVGNAAIMVAARSVAKLSIPIGDKLATCTGFMVTADLLLTNHHCVNTIDTCFGTVAIFGYQRNETGFVLPTRQYDCIAVIKTSKNLDYSLLQIDGNPGAESDWGVLSFSRSCTLADRQPLYMIQHPAGEPKRVALDNCNVTTPKVTNTLTSRNSDFGHKCDTESGSSGSPLMDSSARVVGLHHLGFDAKVKRWSRENRAVYSGRIAAEIDTFLH